MTRTARASFPRAANKDRSENKTGLDPSIRKNGAGQHNWGNVRDERDLELAAAVDEESELDEQVGAQEPEEVIDDIKYRADPPAKKNQNLEEGDIEGARQFRKNALHKKDIDLSAIARTSAAVSTSPPSANKIPVSDTTRLI